MIARRNLLRLVGTAAGAAVLAPFLSRLGRADTPAYPRFVFFVEGNGFEPVTVLSPSTRAALDASMAMPVGTDRYWPRRYQHTAPIETSGDLDQAIALADLGPLAAKTAVLLGLSSKITGGGHTTYHGVLSSTRTSGRRPAGETIDAHLSRLPMLTGTAFDALRLGYASAFHYPGANLDFGTCALEAGVAVPLVRDPRHAFDMLFGVATDRPSFDRAGRILDFAREDVNRTLAAFPSSSPERVKLERYLASIEANLQSRMRLEAAVSSLPTLPPSPSATRTPEDIYTVLSAQAAHIATALQGGLTNVAVLGIGTGYDFDTFYGSDHRPRHDTCHQSETSPMLADYLHMQTRRQMAVMIELARQLEAIPERGATLLDHTVLVYIGDNGETHHASADEFPIVLMGGGALGLRTGNRSLVYPGLGEFSRGHRQVSNLWNTLGHLACEDLDAFGGERLGGGTRSAEGPLTELLG
ncbi:MAG: DUF1552 domain-containing protein [Sandaracinaceae bacterium]|nr:DUF1552 domain-containing protein [Sandaracinaceae bacterium]